MGWTMEKYLMRAGCSICNNYNTFDSIVKDTFGGNAGN